MYLIYSVFTIGCCFSTSLGCEISIMYKYIYIALGQAELMKQVR